MTNVSARWWGRYSSWLCFAYSAVVPATAYLFALLQQGADALQVPLVSMVLLLGFVFAWMLPANAAITPRRIAIVSMAGLCIGWLFAVVMTWGFALLGVWVLPMYAVACFLGRCIGMRRVA